MNRSVSNIISTRWYLDEKGTLSLWIENNQLQVRFEAKASENVTEGIQSSLSLKELQDHIKDCQYYEKELAKLCKQELIKKKRESVQK